MSPEEREALIERLVRSFKKLPRWAQAATKHAMAVPTINPSTGVPFQSFREVLEAAHDETLTTLRDDFEDNGDLLPEEGQG